MVTPIERRGKDKSTGRFQPGNNYSAGRHQLSVREVMDMATSDREVVGWLVEIAHDTNHRDRYRAVERLFSYYFGTPKINVDITTDSTQAEMMRMLYQAMVHGPDSTDVLDVEGGSVTSDSIPTIESTQ